MILMSQKDNILIIRPCHTKGKIMAEIRLSENDNYLNMEKLDKILKDSKEFDKINYSKDIGAITFDFDIRQVFIFSNGFVRIKQAKNRLDAKESFERWDDSIKWEAAIHSFNNAEKLLNTLQKEGLTNYHQQRDELTMVNEKAAKYYTNLQNKNNGVHNT